VEDYKEFRLRLSPGRPHPETNKGVWLVELVQCPLPNLVKGERVSISPVFSREQLKKLRSPTWRTDIEALKAIGRNVWSSIMAPTVEAAFEACLAHVRSKNMGLRIVFSLGNGQDRLDDTSTVRISELPVELLYSDRHSFVATNETTPVSRSLQIIGDTSPTQVTLPLRVLLIVATPTDKPPACMEDELRIVKEAVHDLGNTLIDLELCDPPTRAELEKRLGRREKPCHVFHFIGHGGFGSTGPDPTSQPYISLLRPEEGNKSSSVYAEDLFVLTHNSSIKLAVFTACSTAAASPGEDKPYPMTAFSGLAQRLVSGSSSVTAAIAMQFDLEASAALEFSRTLYSHLVGSESSVDKIVARVRKKLVAHLSAGHRAWATPTVYQRNTESRVFNWLRSQPEAVGVQAHIIISRDRAGGPVLFNADTALVRCGREPSSDIVLDQPASWEHGRIMLTSGIYVYQHLGRHPAVVQRRNGPQMSLSREGCNEEPLRLGDKIIFTETFAIVVLFDLPLTGVYTPTSEKPPSLPLKTSNRSPGE
jgi:hypothetical protein